MKVLQPETSFARTFGAAAIVAAACFAAVPAAAESAREADEAGAEPDRVITADEAKEITDEAEETGFVAPPRTISDITAILEQQKQTGTERTRKLEAKADAERPDTKKRGKLIKFYLKRGEAARKLGRDKQALDDLRESLRIMETAKPGNKLKRQVYERLALTETDAGFFKEATEHIKMSIEIKSTPFNHRSLVQILIQAGALEAAEQAFRRGKAALNRRGGGGGDPEKMARREIELARMEFQLHRAEGRWRRAERTLRYIIGKAPEAYKNNKGSPSFLPQQKRLLAINLLRQRRLVEAEVTAREALLEALDKLGRNSANSADIARVLASVLHAQGRDEEAETLILAVLDMFERAGIPKSSQKYSRAGRTLIDVLVAGEDWEGAVEQIDLAREAMKEVPKAFEKIFLRHQGAVVALLQTGRAEEALEVARAAYEHQRAFLGDDHKKSANWAALVALAEAGLGRNEGALKRFQQAVPVILAHARKSASVSDEEGAKENRTAMVLEGYVGVLAASRGTELEKAAGLDAAAEAFRLAETIRSRAVQRSLAASAARAAARDPGLADLVRGEQDAAKRISVLYNTLADVLSFPTDQQDPARVESLRAKIDKLRAARTALMEGIENDFPQYAQMINPKPATIEDARRDLRAGEALISTLVGRRGTYVWAVPFEGQPAFAASELNAEDMAEEVAILRAALDPKAQSLGEIPDFEVDIAFGLYEELLEPVKDGWKDAESLLVVAHGPLGYLPFAVLPTAAAALRPAAEVLFANHQGVPWLARTHAVTVLPSVASLKTLRSLPPPAAERRAFAGFGDPFFSADQAQKAAEAGSEPVETAALASRSVNTRGRAVKLRAAPRTGGLDDAGLGALPRLPDTSAEINSMAVALRADPTTDVFLGARANESAVKTTKLSGYRVIAFATHGLIPGDLNGLVQPALALSAPGVAEVEGDGLLTMEEIMGLRLDADWVVLSACNTGSGEGAGAEAVSGLGSAFFYAGTRALLVSNWPVETTSARILTTDIFRRQADNPIMTRAEALRQAMVALMDGAGYQDPKTGKTVFSYAHPLFWAPFSLIGDGGGPAS